MYTMNRLCARCARRGCGLPDAALCQERPVQGGVVMGGVLPRKTFSMGHAEEKRYYIECRKITE